MNNLVHLFINTMSVQFHLQIGLRFITIFHFFQGKIELTWKRKSFCWITLNGVWLEWLSICNLILSIDFKRLKGSSSPEASWLMKWDKNEVNKEKMSELSIYSQIILSKLPRNSDEIRQHLEKQTNPIIFQQLHEQMNRERSLKFKLNANKCKQFIDHLEVDQMLFHELCSSFIEKLFKSKDHYLSSYLHFQNFSFELNIEEKKLSLWTRLWMLFKVEIIKSVVILHYLLPNSWMVNLQIIGISCYNGNKKCFHLFKCWILVRISGSTPNRLVSFWMFSNLI